MRSRRGLLSGFATAGSLALAGCTGGGVSPGSDVDTEWPAPAADAAATSYVANASVPRTPPSERWRASVGAPTGRPVVADGVVVVPSERGVTGVDLRSGEERWHRSGPAYGVCARDGTAYATLRGDPAVVALALETGEEEWRTGGEDPFGAAPLVAPAGDRVYAGDTMGHVRAYDASDGAVLWTFDAFTGVYSLAARRDALLVGTTGGEAYQLHGPREDVSPVWRRKLPGTVRSLSADDGTVYASTAGGGLFRLETDHAAGRTRWHAPDAATTTGSLVATGRSVLAVDGDRAVAHASGTGDERWTRPVDGSGATSAPAAAGDTLFVGVGGALRALALDGGTGVGGFRLGDERWRYEATVAATAVADGAVLAACEDLDGEPALVALE